MGVTMTGVDDVTVRLLDTAKQVVDMVVVVETTLLGRLAVEGIITVGSVLHASSYNVTVAWLANSHTSHSGDLVLQVSQLRQRIGTDAHRLANSAGPVSVVATNLAALVGFSSEMTRYIDDIWVPHLLATQTHLSTSVLFKKDFNIGDP